MDKKEIVECLEYELTELNKQQRDFIRYLNDSYGAFLDEKSPPIDLNDLFEDGALNISIFDMHPYNIVEFLKWNSRSWVISSIELIIDYVKKTEPKDASVSIMQIAPINHDLQEKEKGV